MDDRIVLVKALFDSAGEVTFVGVVLRDRPAATAYAHALASLHAAGAMIIGHAHITEFAFSTVDINLHEGDPRRNDHRLIAAAAMIESALVTPYAACSHGQMSRRLNGCPSPSNRKTER